LIRLYEEALQQKPRTPSLTQASFLNRQLTKVRAFTQHLSTLSSLCQIITFGCAKLEKEEDREDLITYCFELVRLGSCPYSDPPADDQVVPGSAADKPKKFRKLCPGPSVIFLEEQPGSPEEPASASSAEGAGESAEERDSQPDWSQSPAAAEQNSPRAGEPEV
jgi:hypothetical protein